MLQSSFKNRGQVFATCNSQLPTHNSQLATHNSTTHILHTPLRIKWEENGDFGGLRGRRRQA